MRFPRSIARPTFSPADAAADAAAAAAATAAATTTAEADAAAAAATAAAATAAATAAGDGTAQAAAAAAAQATADSAAATRVVPESYTLTLPDGSPLDQTDVDAFAVIAKARQWTNEEAQAALADLAEQTAQQHARFREALTAHPEVGGAHLEGAQARALKALDRFLPADTAEGTELRTALTKSGYGNYAPLVLLLSRIGAAMSEDGPLNRPGVGGGERLPTEQVLFKPKP